MSDGRASRVGGAVAQSEAMNAFLSELKLHASIVVKEKPSTTASLVDGSPVSPEGIKGGVGSEVNLTHKVKVLKLTPRLESLSSAAAGRVLNRRCETAAAASILINAVVQYLQQFPPVDQDADSVQGQASHLNPEQQHDAFQDHVYRAFCTIENAGLFHDKKVYKRIERAALHLKRGFGFEPAKEEKPRFLRGFFNRQKTTPTFAEVLKELTYLNGKPSDASGEKTSRHESAQPGEAPAEDHAPGTASVRIETMAAEPQSSGVSLAGFQQIEGGLNSLIMDQIPSMEKGFRGDGKFSHNAVIALLRAGKFGSGIDAISAFLSKRKLQGLAQGRSGSQLGAMTTDSTGIAATAPKSPLTESAGPQMAALPGNGLKATTAAPVIGEPPKHPCNRTPKGSKFAFLGTEELIVNQLTHGDPLGLLLPELRDLQDRIRKCVHPLGLKDSNTGKKEAVESLHSWQGMQTLLTRNEFAAKQNGAGAMSAQKPAELISDLIYSLSRLAQGHHDYAFHVIDYLKSLDTDVLRWLAQNLLTNVDQSPLTPPRMHGRSCKNLLEALFCEGSNQPHCIHFFQHLQAAFLLAIPAPERDSAVNDFLTSLMVGVKLPDDQSGGEAQQSLRDKWDAFAKVREKVEHGLLALDPTKPGSSMPVASPEPFDGAPGSFHLQKERFEQVFGGMLLASCFHLNKCLGTDLGFRCNRGARSSPESAVDPRLESLLVMAGLTPDMARMTPKERRELETEQQQSLEACEAAIVEEGRELGKLVDSQIRLIKKIIAMSSRDASVQKTRLGRKDGHGQVSDREWASGGSSNVEKVAGTESANETVARMQNAPQAKALHAGVDAPAPSDVTSQVRAILLEQSDIRNRVEDWEKDTPGARTFRLSRDESLVLVGLLRARCSPLSTAPAGQIVQNVVAALKAILNDSPGGAAANASRTQEVNCRFSDGCFVFS